ncbi:MAG: DUF368 domain-containing protein [Cellvibrionaceae bacterium]|nr:DUF368 domain-containing protein [Cellvibrionaceae bacterium]
MGAADLVPGVSGGTVAFITGIYQRLLAALKSLNPLSLRLWLREGFKAFWAAIDGGFLLILFAGILTSVLSLATIISHALAQYPILVWSFFFGLVSASVVYLARQIPRWQWQQLLAIALAAAIALAISAMRPAQLPAQWWMLFIAGAIAICAMILPGISGSFILLLMGLYSVVIDALKTFDSLLLISFAGGCGVGLLGFSHLLSWLLLRYYYTTLAFLTGFLLGALPLLWPWKQVVETAVDRHGEQIPLVQKNIWPAQFAEITQQPAWISGAVLCLISGFLLVLLLESVGRRHQNR